ncbi:hypothetical protein KM043_001013 [Ampulex compressa]|nr:hypothetical protein KM043_001013 [Ampulex compressa]
MFLRLGVAGILPTRTIYRSTLAEHKPAFAGETSIESSSLASGNFAISPSAEPVEVHPLAAWPEQPSRRTEGRPPSELLMIDSPAIFASTSFRVVDSEDEEKYAYISTTFRMRKRRSFFTKKSGSFQRFPYGSGQSERYSRSADFGKKEN